MTSLPQNEPQVQPSSEPIDLDYARSYAESVYKGTATGPPDETKVNGAAEYLRAMYEERQRTSDRQAVLNVARAFLIAKPELKPILDIAPPRKRWFREDELDELPKPEPLLETDGIYIPKSAVGQIFGESGIGKSFLAVHLALTQAQESPVIYIAAEKAELYPDRRKAWYQHHKLPSKGNFHLLRDTLDATSEQAVEQFITEAKERANGVQFIVIDTLARCLAAVGRHESDTRDMGMFLEGCERIKRELNCTVLLVHHTGKTGLSDRGSYALRAGCDFVIKLTNSDSVITATNEKQSSAPEFDPVHFRLLPVEVDTDNETGDLVENLTLIPSGKVITLPGQKLTDSQRRIIEVLAMSSFDKGAKTRDLKSVAEILNERTFYRALSQLKDMDYIERQGKYEPWLLTESGQRIAKQFTDSH